MASPSEGQRSSTGETTPTRLATLRAYGLAGVLSYGLLNTLYYSVAFLVAWTTVVQAPSGLGYAAAGKAFAKTFVLVWAGSQLTKPLRAAGAVVGAPLAKRLLGAVRGRLPPGWATDGSAFAVLVLGCLLVACALFAGIVVLSA
jgi:hypothetical protein